MKKILLACAATCALAMPGFAQAAIVTKTFDITGTNWSVYFGTPTPFLVDPAHLNFTVTADDSANTPQTTSGLTINSFNLPYSLEYAITSGNLIIATDILSGNGGCNHPANSFCAFIASAFSATPSVYFMEQSSAQGGWIAGSMRLSNGTPDGVPEPSTWAMMLLGMGAVGFAMRRRKVQPAKVRFAF